MQNFIIYKNSINRNKRKKNQINIKNNNKFALCIYMPNNFDKKITSLMNKAH